MIFFGRLRAGPKSFNRWSSRYVFPKHSFLGSGCSFFGSVTMTLIACVFVPTCSNDHGSGTCSPNETWLNHLRREGSSFPGFTEKSQTQPLWFCGVCLCFFSTMWCMEVFPNLISVRIFSSNETSPRIIMKCQSFIHFILAGDRNHITVKCGFPRSIVRFKQSEHKHGVLSPLLPLLPSPFCFVKSWQNSSRKIKETTDLKMPLFSNPFWECWKTTLRNNQPFQPANADLAKISPWKKFRCVLLKSLMVSLVNT